MSAPRAVDVLASDAELATAGAAELYLEEIRVARVNSHFGDERVWWPVLHLEQRFPRLPDRLPEGTWARANNDAAHPEDRLTDAEIENVNEAVHSFIPLDGTYEQIRRGYARVIASQKASTGRTMTPTTIYLVLSDELHERLRPYPPDMDERLLKWARRRERHERQMEALKVRRMRQALTRLIAPAELMLVTQGPKRTDRKPERGGSRRRVLRSVRSRARSPGRQDDDHPGDDELARRLLQRRRRVA